MTTFPLKIWKHSTRTLQRLLSGHQEAISSICYAKADTILVSASQLEDAIRTWNVETGELLHVIRAESVVGLSGSPHHALVVATTFQGHGSMVCNTECARFWNFPIRAGAAVFRPDGRSIITGCWGEDEEGLWTWDLGLLLKDQNPELPDQAALLTGSMDSSELVGAQLDGPQVSFSDSLLIATLTATSVPRRISGPYLFRQTVTWQLLHPTRMPIWSSGTLHLGNLS